MADEPQKELEAYKILPSKFTSTSTAERVARFLMELAGMRDPMGGMGPMPLDFSLKEPANSIIAKIMNKVINSRNELYHGTYVDPAEAILRSGEIKPKNYPGVSVSRIPKIATFDHPVHFVLDPKEIPPAQQIAEQGYGKTFTDISTGYPKQIPNNSFEYENRTLNKQPIPIDAIKKILVTDPYYKTSSMGRGLRSAAAEANIPIENVSQAELPKYRAIRSWMDYYKLRELPRGLRDWLTLPKQSFVDILNEKE